ncbi:TonB-dependent receptor [bacterium SCSIO 12741]|nr:TonB-dependent receptor [bacterium SCSIO 12741]
MKNSVLAFLALILFTGFAHSQEKLSVIKGVVMDKSSQFTIPGANVVLVSVEPKKGVSTDAEGRFRIEGVAPGRHQIQVSFLGYETQTMSNLLVVGAKELEIQVELVESFTQLKEVVVSSEGEKTEAINEMAMVSARQFSVEEAARYSGALQDPARMATNFAGVSGANDSRNDIIIRGNSPSGVLWRMEGIDIPSPNHFATLGTTGGPVGMLNLNNLANSDFLTGAWSSDYGNALSGVFDLRLREGNRDKYEFLAQVGFNGFEVGAEGPFSKKKKGSFLANYRYSTLGVFQALGINLGTGAAIPQYQDLTFKMNFPTEKAGTFSVFGVGGTSFIEFKAEDSDSLDLFSDAYTNTRYSSTTAIVGASHKYFFNPKLMSKLTVAASYTQTLADIDSISDVDRSEIHTYGQNFQQTKYSLNYKLNKKFNSRNTMNGGVIFDRYEMDVNDSIYKPEGDYYRVITDFNGGFNLMQLFVQWKHRFNKDLSVNLGLHSQHLLDNGSFNLEPRFAAKYRASGQHVFEFGTGLYSQIQPITVYFVEEKDAAGNSTLPNEGLDFSRSAHFVLGHNYLINENLHLKSEVYYQYLFNVPVDATSSSFSMINQGSDFEITTNTGMVNQGDGYNYGLELTLEKFFSRGYYFLTTGSLFESKYRGSDGIVRNTAFNTNYVFNGLAGKEFKLKKGMSLSFDTKVTYAGGRRYTPIDLEASRQAGTEIRKDDLAYSERYNDYFRWDFKITLRHNFKKISQQFAIDIQNLTNNQNVFAYGYNPRTGEIATTYQRGFFPDVQYKIYF